LFRFSLLDFCNKSVNHICGGVNDDTSVWHSRLCHINFDLMSRLSSISLISKFTIAKGSKCQNCVQSKQPRKPHTTVEERNLAPLELTHSDLCKMNCVLTKDERIARGPFLVFSFFPSFSFYAFFYNFCI
jgi:hypothetical protein